mmetsp:Transcript_10902/g.34731  ORF Transcript_10902/g.34731 Transcript_10902/m.34731 type:complete len:319 (+) Transcript_10902:124-1080(+)
MIWPILNVTSGRVRLANPALVFHSAPSGFRIALSYCSLDVNGYGTRSTMCWAPFLSRRSEITTFCFLASRRFGAAAASFDTRIRSRTACRRSARLSALVLSASEPSPAQLPHPSSSGSALGFEASRAARFSASNSCRSSSDVDANACATSSSCVRLSRPPPALTPSSPSDSPSESFSSWSAPSSASSSLPPTSPSAPRLRFLLRCLRRCRRFRTRDASSSSISSNCPPTSSTPSLSPAPPAPSSWPRLRCLRSPPAATERPTRRADPAASHGFSASVPPPGAAAAAPAVADDADPPWGAPPFLGCCSCSRASSRKSRG